MPDFSFEQKTKVFEDVAFYHQMFNVSNYLLDLGVCIVHVLSLIQSISKPVVNV